MRQRTKMTGLCSHTTPDGKSHMGKQEILRKKFNAGEITRQELQTYAYLIIATKTDKPKTVKVRVFGKEIEVSYDEYKKRYEPLGF